MAKEISDKFNPIQTVLRGYKTDEFYLTEIKNSSKGFIPFVGELDAKRMIGKFEKEVGENYSFEYNPEGKSITYFLIE